MSCDHEATHPPPRLLGSRVEGGGGHVRADQDGGGAAAAAALGGNAAAGERGRGRGSGGFGARLTFSLCPQVSAAAAAGAFPKRVKVVEVGPRDGLQNEKVRAGLGALSPSRSLSEGGFSNQTPVRCRSAPLTGSWVCCSVFFKHRFLMLKAGGGGVCAVVEKFLVETITSGRFSLLFLRMLYRHQ